MKYRKTKGILHIMQFLCQRNIKTTLMYTQLLNLTEDEYVCKAAKTFDEASKLIESVFDYVTDIEGLKLFKKRK